MRKIKTKLVLRLLDIDINDNNPQQRRQKLVTYEMVLLKVQAYTAVNK